MTEIRLLNEFSSLPDELKKEVMDFVSQLKDKAGKQRQPKQREFGVAKGFFVVGEDFDEPLEDFKEYM